MVQSQARFFMYFRCSKKFFSSQGVHVWDVDDQILIRKYQGAVQGFYTIFATFGGSNEQYVASGSEGIYIYVYEVMHVKSAGHMPTSSNACKLAVMHQE